MRMHKLLKQPAGADEDCRAPSTGAEIAALYLSGAVSKENLPAYYTMDRYEPMSRLMPI